MFNVSVYHWSIVAGAILYMATTRILLSSNNVLNDSSLADKKKQSNNINKPQIIGTK